MSSHASSTACVVAGSPSSHAAHSGPRWRCSSSSVGTVTGTRPSQHSAQLAYRAGHALRRRTPPRPRHLRPARHRDRDRRAAGRGRPRLRRPDAGRRPAARHRPRRRRPGDRGALPPAPGAGRGGARDGRAEPDDIAIVVNCHLHFDHIGENPRFAGRPIVVQRRELATARDATQPDYTVPALVDFAGARYESLDGEAEIAAGVHVVPTPGHVAGHQSLVVVCEDGTVVLAGQAHDTASQWSADVLAARAAALGHEPPLPLPSPWMERILAFDPRRVLFAHDAAVWTP
ncbi:MBL fold metallo-hydrolase [Pimelobacter simplex]|uniref:MBL fold metallo-hydrolase n=1 Tax=Nocardioides simplex TaxID=2045 RepID=UPI003AAB9F48